MTKPTRELAPVPELDLFTLTLGEAEALEREAGRPLNLLLTSGPATLRLMAVWVAERRRVYGTSEPPQTWQQLGRRPMYAPSSSSSPSGPDSASPTSES